jgi:hypothetical protein
MNRAAYSDSNADIDYIYNGAITVKRAVDYCVIGIISEIVNATST